MAKQQIAAETYKGFPVHTSLSKVRKSPLFKALASAVRKQDHDELARMLSLVSGAAYFAKDPLSQPNLGYAFPWISTPQGYRYWHELYCSVENFRREPDALRLENFAAGM